MLRLSLLILLLANAGYFAWSQGWMASMGWQPETQSEPFRFKQQIRPEAIQVGTPIPAGAPLLNAASAASAASTPSALATMAETAPARCWQVGHFDEAQAVSVRTALLEAHFVQGSWELQTSPMNGRWMVYLGKFPNNEALEVRRNELRQRGISYDRAGGQLEPGLSLGRFTTEEAATRELTTMLRQGVRGARVVQERADGTLYTLRLPAVTPEMHERLEQIKPVFAGKPLRLCEG